MLKVYPAVYSKAQTAQKVREMLAAYPEQKCNTKEAFAGKVFEVTTTPGGGPVGSLPEIKEAFKVTAVIIVTRKGSVTARCEGEKWLAD